MSFWVGNTNEAYLKAEGDHWAIGQPCIEHFPTIMEAKHTVREAELLHTRSGLRETSTMQTLIWDWEWVWWGHA